MIIEPRKVWRRKSFLVLANSIKNNHRCIAGIELQTCENAIFENIGRWVRPVSKHSGGAISLEELSCTNGKATDVFDIVEIALQGTADVQGQPEDWFIEPSLKWNYLWDIKGA